MTPEKNCCTPSVAALGGASRGDTGRGSPSPTGGGVHTLEQVTIPAQTFAMGDHHADGHPGDGETPVHPVTLTSFTIDATSVTNADFAAFVDATGYETESEKQGFSAVFHLAFEGADDDILSVLRQIPDRQYDRPNAVSHEISEAQ